MSTICFDDPIYGETCFSEPLLVDLYQTAAVQRLQHIYQGGITALINPKRRTTRLDHSRGVLALLRRLGADPIEQAAGLIHDVAHTAFSHVIDFVFPNKEHTYHEALREEMILHSDIPAVLTAHGQDWHTVAIAENFPLLEQPLPRLCADRLDYFLRDGAVDIGTFTVADARYVLQHLTIIGGQIAVDDIDVARWIGEQFIHLDDICWCSIQEVGWYAVMAQALRIALDHNIITKADFGGTDGALWQRLLEAHNPSVDSWLHYLRPDIDFARTTADECALVALPKVRAVDPPVLSEGHAVALSRLDPLFETRRQAYISRKQGEWYLKIVKPTRA